MGEVKFLFFRRGGWVERSGIRHEIASPSLIVSDSHAMPKAVNQEDVQTYSFRTGEFQLLFREVAEIMYKSDPGALFWREPVKQLPLTQELVNVMCRLGEIDRVALLRFVYVYCLGLEPKYFSQLLYYFVDSSREFFDFIDANAMNPWPVAQYASELGMSVRKLNMLFFDKFGVSAKHWLLGKRLRHAKELLLHTSMKVTDIAQECGFNSHAHFSDCFRRRYNECPRQTRFGSNFIKAEEKE